MIQMNKQAQQNYLTTQERLLDDWPEVVQVVGQAALGHLVVSGECPPDRLLHLLNHRQIPHLLPHCPLERRRRRLAAGTKHVLLTFRNHPLPGSSWPEQSIGHRNHFFGPSFI